jgi:hypothetical protein
MTISLALRSESESNLKKCEGLVCSRAAKIFFLSQGADCSDIRKMPEISHLTAVHVTLIMITNLNRALVATSNQDYIWQCSVLC